MQLIDASAARPDAYERKDAVQQAGKSGKNQTDTKATGDT